MFTIYIHQNNYRKLYYSKVKKVKNQKSKKNLKRNETEEVFVEQKLTKEIDSRKSRIEWNLSRKMPLQKILPNQKIFVVEEISL